MTRPTLEMRKAMADAVVGDDVFGDDPTVHELELQAAHLFEKQVLPRARSRCVRTRGLHSLFEMQMLAPSGAGTGVAGGAPL